MNLEQIPESQYHKNTSQLEFYKSVHLFHTYYEQSKSKLPYWWNNELTVIFLRSSYFFFKSPQTDVHK
jgi:hypothetical protein